MICFSAVLLCIFQGKQLFRWIVQHFEWLMENCLIGWWSVMKPANLAIMF